MGVSTDAILVFGINLGEDGDELYDQYREAIGEENDFEEFIVFQANLDHSDPDYFEKREAVLKNCPMDITVHCCDNEPMVILGLRGTETTAWRGDVKIINPEDLVIPEQKIQAAYDWCVKHKLPWEEPKWLLVSWWG